MHMQNYVWVLFNGSEHYMWTWPLMTISPMDRQSFSGSYVYMEFLMDEDI